MSSHPVCAGRHVGGGGVLSRAEDAFPITAPGDGAENSSTAHSLLPGGHGVETPQVRKPQWILWLGAGALGLGGGALCSPRRETGDPPPSTGSRPSLLLCVTLRQPSSPSTAVVRSGLSRVESEALSGKETSYTSSHTSGLFSAQT